MNSETERVSVVIPAYNAGNYLAEAIESVLAQSEAALEIIVVDDGSTDNTAEVARHHDVHLISQDNQGISGAMNTGVSAATGEFIASLDADDLWLPNKLELQLQALRSQPQLDMVFAHTEQFLCPTLEGTQHKLHIPEELRILPGYSSQSMLIRREPFFRVGLFNTAYKIGDFLEWYSRAQDAGLTSTMLPDILSRRRVHGSNTGVKQKMSQVDYLRILKASLDRRRAKQA